MSESPGQRHEYRMGIVGNCSYMAHVDLSGSVVWLCWPRFDSSPVFQRLLDPEGPSVFSVLPSKTALNRRQRYLPNTNVLETTIDTEEGSFRITDCAPRFFQHDRFFKPLALIRKVEPVAGAPRIKVTCFPTGDYGKFLPEVSQESNHIRFDLAGDRVRLNTNISLSYVLNDQYFVLNETKYLVLTWGRPFEAPLERTAESYLKETVRYWQDWVRQCSIGRFYQRHVIRSALTLKLHQYEDTGAIIASATTSLPEAPGTGRNWDYRYCWLRDAYYTLTAFSRISQFEEMQKFAHFIENIAAKDLQRYPPVVAVDGTLEMPERILALSGYDGSDQVRIGNQAALHVQNDVYGQMIYALLQLHVDERFLLGVRQTSKELIMKLLGKIEATLTEPDATLWEFRGTAMRHGYTYLFHWVGGKAAAKIAHHTGDKQMLRAATRLIARSASHLEKCYNAELQAYAQAPGSSNMDASLLQLITLYFIDPKSERAAKHLEAIEKSLKTPEGLLYRYTHADDFGKPKTTFLLCAFWYVEALAVMGRVGDALKVLENLLTFSNHLGLFSEDVEAVTGGQWGNFPQTYSHVGLMNAVMRITDNIDYPDFF